MTRTSKQRSLKQENRLAATHGGSVNAMSGGGWVRKNDVLTDEYSIEAKTTGKSQYPLKTSELLLAERNALLAGRTMLFVIDMDGRTWITLAEEDFLILKDRACGDETPDSST